MFERWYVLDVGAHTFRLYDVRGDELVRFPACYGVCEGRVEKVGKEALSFVYRDPRRCQVHYPVDDGYLLHDLRVLVHEGLRRIGAHEHLLKPSLLVYVPFSLPETEREKWQEILQSEGVKKVRFVTLVDVYESFGDTRFVIHVGHSVCEMAIFVEGRCVIRKSIPFAGRQVGEAIQTLVAKKTNCLISGEDANAMMLTASSLLQERKNATLSAAAFDRYQNYVKIQVRGSDLWPCFLEVENQIAWWAKSLFETVSLPAQEKIASRGVDLHGGLAELFGLSKLLSKELQCPVICSKDPEYDMLKTIKELA
ncbi:rod shape-determining protein [uncultured Dubosiella sp.]|uniref:rod shape-determining protein n=1 Tax=uncultured Dubosiella sp. TaxID=1937011 RepID=UPI002599D13D|nr:rod shape-determining protein [uncultured Dubosiella sp.]